jgi:hypothetical protein
MAANKYKALAKQADAAFKGKYKDDLNKLAGLSRAEIDAITPDEEDLRAYFHPYESCGAGIGRQPEAGRAGDKDQGTWGGGDKGCKEGSDAGGIT